MSIVLAERPPRRELRRVAFTSANRPASAAVTPGISSHTTGSDTRNQAPISSDTSGSDNQTRAAQITYSTSVLCSDDLLSALVVARAKRGKRKRLNRPSLPLDRHYWRTRKAEAPGAFERVNFHLRRLARRALNDLAKAGHDAPPLEALAAALALYVHEQIPQIVRVTSPGAERDSRYERWRRLDHAAVERVSASAARYTLECWRPDYIREQQRRGAAGGSASRRGPTWTAEDLDALAVLMATEPHLTRQQQADWLGLALSMVKRMRAALRAES